MTRAFGAMAFMCSLGTWGKKWTVNAQSKIEARHSEGLPTTLPNSLLFDGLRWAYPLPAWILGFLYTPYPFFGVESERKYV